MGLLTREVRDRDSETGYRKAINWPVVGTAGGLSALFLAATLFSGLYINEAREVSLEVKFGDVVDQEDTPGLKWKTPWLSSRHAYSLARQTSVIDNSTSLRMGDDIRLTGGFTIEWEIKEGTDIKKLYFDLKDREGDLDDVVTVRGRDAAIRALESLTIQDLIPEQDIEAMTSTDTEAEGTDADGADVETSESFTDKMTTGIQTRLQTEFDQQEWPIRVIAVYSNGFEFEPESEEKLAEIVGIRQDRVKLILREENAQKAKEVYGVEAEADAAYLRGLVEAGYPVDQLDHALCMKMQRDAGRVNEPFAAGCGGSNSGVGVVVDPAAVNNTAPKPVVVPNP